jgi:hypothetical protein
VDGNAADRFGTSVALSADGSAMAVGGGSTANSGYTRVYDFLAGAGWTQRGAQINGELSGYFSGWAVTLF